MRHYTERLHPGMDLKKELLRIIQEQQIKAGVVLSLVGSLTMATLRLADGKTIKTWDEPFEIVSATGTLAAKDMHLHISLAGEDAKVIGGHVKIGCIVHTTVEVVFGIFDDVEYSWEQDDETGYPELVLTTPTPRA